MTFDEWWYKYGIEIDIPKNEACTIWMAALNNVEALKPSHNTQSKPCQHAWEPIVGKRCVTCGKFDYAITDTPY